MIKIPDKYRDLLDRPIVVSLATLMSDGPPQVQPVWGSFDGTHILVNAEKSRQKYRNLSRRRAVTILAIDPDDDSRWLEVRGTVVSETGGAPTGTSMSWRGSIWASTSTRSTKKATCACSSRSRRSGSRPWSCRCRISTRQRDPLSRI
jgi:hypothetical protein